MVADKRIPVTDETWQQLHDMKKAGQTYDNLIRELIEQSDRDPSP